MSSLELIENIWRTDGAFRTSSSGARFGSSRDRGFDPVTQPDLLFFCRFVLLDRLRHLLRVGAGVGLESNFTCYGSRPPRIKKCRPLKNIKTITIGELLLINKARDMRLVILMIYNQELYGIGIDLCKITL
jgi:hypothetical protein